MPETQILTISEAMEITQEIPEIFAQLLELYNAEVEFVELGVEGDQIIIREVEKSNPTSSSVHVPSVNRDRDKLLVSKAVDEEKRYTLAPWYVPDVLDAHGEWTDKEEVQRAFWDYLKREDRSIRLQHNMDIIAGEWVEGLTWPHGVTVPIKHPEGETEITFPAGTPFLGVIWEPWAWQLIKDGEIRGLSIGGRGKRVEADIEDYDYDPMGKVSFAKMIRTEADRYAVYAYDDSSSFGEYDSRQEAEERLKQIEYFAKADFKVGDFVSWNSSGGRARGKIQTIAIDREIKVPDSSFTITGTNDEPAALIVVWREGADGWEKTDRKVGHKLDALTPIDALQKAEALSPLQSVVNNAKTFLEKHLKGQHDQKFHARGGYAAVAQRRQEQMNNVPPLTTDANGKIVNPDATGGYKALIPESIELQGFEHPLTPQDSMWHHLESDGEGGFKVTKERALAHEAIIKNTVNPVAPSDNPTFTMLGGGPASGKSTFVDSTGLIPDRDVAVHVNSDEMKAELPEFNRMKNAYDDSEFFHAAGFAHEESSYLAEISRKNAMAQSKPVVLDGTGNGTYEKFAGKINEARARGYRVEANYVTVPTDIAVDRSFKRSLKQSERRFVSEITVRDTHSAVSRTFPNAVEDGMFDSFSLWDTGSGEPKMIANGTGSNLSIIDNESYQAFLDKGR